MEPRDRLYAMIFGFQPAQLVHVMARLRLADLVVGGATTIDELSAASGARPDMLVRVVRGLESLGLLDIDADGRIALSEVGALLCADRPDSMSAVALFGGAVTYRAWGELERTVRTGEPAFDEVFGDSFFAYLRGHPEHRSTFDGTMSQLSMVVIADAVARYDFSGTSRVLDVGGGLGHFVTAVLAAHPELHGAVFDVPAAVEAAARHLATTDLADRCEAVGGDFFESVPAGYDVHLLKWVLHNWDDDSCRRLLTACRAALPDDGRLLVVERLLPEKVSRSGAIDPAIDMDLRMLVNFAVARERQLAEYEDLLGGCGFAIHDVIVLPSGTSIVDFRLRVE